MNCSELGELNIWRPPTRAPMAGDPSRPLYTRDQVRPATKQSMGTSSSVLPYDLLQCIVYRSSIKSWTLFNLRSGYSSVTGCVVTQGGSNPVHRRDIPQLRKYCISSMRKDVCNLCQAFNLITPSLDLRSDISCSIIRMTAKCSTLNVFAGPSVEITMPVPEKARLVAAAQSTCLSLQDKFWNITKQESQLRKPCIPPFPERSTFTNTCTSSQISYKIN